MSEDKEEPRALDNLIDKFFQGLAQSGVCNICSACSRPIITICPDCKIDLSNSERSAER